MPDQRVRHRVMLAVLALCGGVAAADNPKQADPAADEELLEFLGSVDAGADSQAAADDGSWIDYLAQTDIGKVAKRADPNGGSQKKTATPVQPAAPGDEKDD